MISGGPSGRQVCSLVLVALAATAVVPPGVATALNEARKAATRQSLVAADHEWRGVSASTVVHGPGRDLVRTNRLLALLGDRVDWQVQGRWQAVAVPVPAELPRLPSDAWGRRVFLSERWIVSAGPNGVIETPVDAASSVGDDIAVGRS